MAYKTFSGSTFFSLDGVPFIISDKWKPPKKVTLPLKFETGNPSEVLFLEYDSAVEENLLAHFEAEHEMEKAAAAVATAAAAAAVDSSASAKPTDEDASGAVKYRSPPGQNNDLSHIRQTNSNNDHQSGLAMQTGVTANAAAFMAKRSGAPIVATNAAYHVLNGNILMPTPITAPSESVLQGRNQGMNSFDLKDFENEQDPFENLSLKVINDIEELDKVFLATSGSQSNIGASSQGVRTSPSEAVDQRNEEQEQNFSSNSVHHANRGAMLPLDGRNTSQRPFEEVTAENLMGASGQGTAVFYPSVPCSTALVNYMASSSAVSSGNSRGAWLPPTHPPVSQNYEARIPDSILTGNLMSSVLQPKHEAMTSERHNKSELSSTVQTPRSVTSASSKQISFTGNSVLYGCSQPGRAWPLEATGSHCPPVAPLDYRGPFEDSNRGQLEHDYSRMSCPSNLPLRSAKSNPDLSVVDASIGGSFGWYGRHTPPILDTRSHSKPDRANINQAFVARNHSSLSVGLPHAQNVALHSGKVNQPSEEEGTLYSCLSNEAQNFVDFITAMGFSQLQTIRAVEKLGIDEKLVFDHLCGYSKLIEKGYTARDVENGLFLFDGDLNKAEDYAKLASNFRAMGFEEEKISTALVKCSLDGDMSLDWLTS